MRVHLHRGVRDELRPDWVGPAERGVPALRPQQGRVPIHRIQLVQQLCVLPARSLARVLLTIDSWHDYDSSYWSCNAWAHGVVSLVRIVRLALRRCVLLISYSGTFLVFSVACFAGYLWSTYVVPETANVSLEEIDAVFGSSAGQEDVALKAQVYLFCFALRIFLAYFYNRRLKETLACTISSASGRLRRSCDEQDSMGNKKAE